MRRVGDIIISDKKNSVLANNNDIYKQSNTVVDMCGESTRRCEVIEN